MRITTNAAVESQSSSSESSHRSMYQEEQWRHAHKFAPSQLDSENSEDFVFEDFTACRWTSWSRIRNDHCRRVARKNQYGLSSVAGSNFVGARWPTCTSDRRTFKLRPLTRYARTRSQLFVFLFSFPEPLICFPETRTTKIRGHAGERYRWPRACDSLVRLLPSQFPPSFLFGRSALRKRHSANGHERYCDHHAVGVGLCVRAEPAIALLSSESTKRSRGRTRRRRQ